MLHGSLSGSNVGAGIVASAAGLTLDGVTVQANTAAGTGANGGGVWAFASRLDVDNSSFYLNQAVTGAALATVLTPGTIRRSTFYLNGGSASNAAAVAWVQCETVTFENDTMAGNVANNGTGGIIASNSGATSGVVIVVSSTLAANPTDSAAGAAVLAACTGSVVNEGGNLEWPGTSCGFGTNADPKLGAIVLDGGRTFNYALLPGSPAIELGGASCPACDQRGAARPDGDACDAGSYEAPAPETQLSGPTSDPTNVPAITFTSPDTPAASFECQVDPGAFAACSSPCKPQLADGQHTPRVRAIDTAGYADPSPAATTFTVDTTAPVVTITGAPTSPTSDTTPTVTFTVDDATATLQCQVDAGPRRPCSSPFTTAELPEGKHTITIYATDPVGNEGKAVAPVAISFGAPDTTITSGPSGTIYNETSSSFAFMSSKPNSTFECRLDAAAFELCTSRTSTTICRLPSSQIATIAPFDSAQWTGPTGTALDTPAESGEYCGDAPLGSTNAAHPCPYNLAYTYSLTAIAADATGVHVVWTSERADGQAKTFARSSADSASGVTRAAPLDDAVRGHQRFPDIASADGVISVVFYDSRCDPGYDARRPPGNSADGHNSGGAVDAYVAQPTDGGRTWRERPVTEAPSNPGWELGPPGTNQVRRPYFGFYNSISAVPGAPSRPGPTTATSSRAAIRVTLSRMTGSTCWRRAIGSPTT